MIFIFSVFRVFELFTFSIEHYTKQDKKLLGCLFVCFQFLLKHTQKLWWIIRVKDQIWVSHKEACAPVH